MHPVLMWGGFVIFVISMLILDLCVFQRRAHVVSIRESLLWTAFWITLALLFNVGVWWFRGSEKALEFVTAFLLEKSLSVDNIFVFLLIFSYFRVPPESQHKVLFWGILGALILRALFIVTGVALIQQFHWIIYVFGTFLVLTGIKMATEKDKELHPEKNPVLRLFRKFVPVSDHYDGNRFFIKQSGKLVATPLIVVLLVIETTDVVFAVDSIPAVFAVTLDPFIVYTSNVFAILGLRALYFAVAGVVRKFHFLHYGLSFILVFVGIKMLISDHYHIPIGIALGVLGVVLTLSVILSLVFPERPKTAS